MAKNTKTPVMVLQELCIKQGLDLPVYDIVFNIVGTHQNRFDFKVKVDGIEAIGTGTSKQISKHKAAHNLLMKLKELDMYDPNVDPVEEFKSISNVEAVEGNFKQPNNYIGPLKDLCAQQKIPLPEFQLLSDVGPPHSKEFTFECIVASMRTVATGNTKKMAKQLAAKEMLDRIKKELPRIMEDYQQREEQQRECIADVNTVVVEKYNDLFNNVITDKSVKVSDYSGSLKRLMIEYGKTIEDFEQHLAVRSEDSLKQILKKLDLDYRINQIQDNPVVVYIELTLDTPFTIIGVEDRREAAVAMALNDVFDILNLFLRL